MRIIDLRTVPVRAGFFVDDQAAITAGAARDGFGYRGEPVTPGFSAIRQAGEALSVLLFLDDKPKSKAIQTLFSDPAFGSDLYEKAAFSKVEFKKDSDECKKWNVTEAPTILIVDPSAEEGASLKILKGGAHAGFATLA